PTAFGSEATVCWTRPLEAFADAAPVTFELPMKIFWNASCVPEAAVRTIRLIDPLVLAPGTCDQLRIRPEKMPWICDCDRLPTPLRGFVTTQIASLAIRLNTRLESSLLFLSREELPIETRPAATSATPTSEPPWARRNRARFGNVLLYCRASSDARGAT